MASTFRLSHIGISISTGGVASFCHRMGITIYCIIVFFWVLNFIAYIEERVSLALSKAIHCSIPQLIPRMRCFTSSTTFSALYL